MIWTSLLDAGVSFRMHTVRQRTKLVARVRRVKGQIEGVERALAATELARVIRQFVG